MSETSPSESDLIEGFSDGYVNGVFKGWAWYPTRPEQNVVIEILVDVQFAAEGVATLRRGDLASAGKRKGDCAFSIPLALNEICPPGTVQITVRSKDGQVVQGGEFPLKITEPRTEMPVAFGGPVG